MWGTRKRESCNEIAKEMVRVVGKMSSRFFISKHVGQWNEKKVWWFVVKAQERDLVTLDEQWKHKYWRWQKVGRGELDFLAVEPVSEGHRCKLLVRWQGEGKKRDCLQMVGPEVRGG